MACRRAILLGCTGSIGSSAVKGIEAVQDQLTIVAISAHSNTHKLIQIVLQTHPEAVCLTDAAVSIEKLRSELPKNIKVYHGPDGLVSMLQDVQADIVLNGIVGGAGLPATLASLESGKDVALANKESIVMAGQFLFSHARQLGRKIIPVDSEHSALHCLIQAHGADQVQQLVITASGGPFRTLPIEQFPSITVEQAIAHPTWKMGAKISVDSATLANKGLEVIEAAYLFGFPADQIEVTVHPQSIVHSMIRLTNGAVYAQMSPSDMTLPIMDALCDGRFTLEHVVRPLDFSHLNLSFEAPDMLRFPMLSEAFDCIRLKGSYCIAFNAADEIAVQAFLDKRCSFTDIPQIVARTLDQDWSYLPMDYASVLQQDHQARTIARNILASLNG